MNHTIHLFKWKAREALPISGLLCSVQGPPGLTSPGDRPRPRRAKARRARSFTDGNAREASQSIQRGLSPEPHRDDSSSREERRQRPARRRAAGGGRRRIRRPRPLARPGAARTRRGGGPASGHEGGGRGSASRRGHVAARPRYLMCLCSPAWPSTWGAAGALR